MRTPGLLFAAIFVACLHPGSTYGQGGEPPRPEEQPETYRKHHDTRHGHDHFYPDRGAILRDVPQGAVVVNYAGLSYRFHDGIWFEPRGPAFMVVAAPIGLIVPTLPTFTTLLARGGEIYLYCNDTYYRPKPDLKGYEVVNDPSEATSQAKSEAGVGGPPAVTPVVQAATSAPVATAALIGPPAPAIVDGPPPIVSAAPMPTATPSIPAATMKTAAVAPAETPYVATPIPTPGMPGSVATPPASGSTPVASVATGTPAVAVSGVVAPASAVAAAAVPVTLTAASSPTPSTPPKGVRAGLNPKNGQSAEQVAHDRYDCYRFAVTQSGFDPIRPGSSVSQEAVEAQSNYERAQTACFEGRGYTIQ